MRPSARLSSEMASTTTLLSWCENPFSHLAPLGIPSHLPTSVPRRSSLVRQARLAPANCTWERIPSLSGCEKGFPHQRLTRGGGFANYGSLAGFLSADGAKMACATTAHACGDENCARVTTARARGAEKRARGAVKCLRGVAIAAHGAMPHAHEAANCAPGLDECAGGVAGRACGGATEPPRGSARGMAGGGAGPARSARSERRRRRRARERAGSAGRHWRRGQPRWRTRTGPRGSERRGTWRQSGRRIAMGQECAASAVGWEDGGM
jgi:hypothetical protein